MPRLIAPTAVSAELLEACTEIIDGIELGSTGHVALEDGDDPKTVKMALKQVDPYCRVFRARNDGDATIRVRRYTAAQIEERGSRPPVNRKAKAKK